MLKKAKDLVFPPSSKHRILAGRIRKNLRYWRRNPQRNQNLREAEYQQWLARHKPSATSLKQQESQSNKFSKKPLISLILPAYNTMPQHLAECLDSVLAQTYSKWQLCIADDASTDPNVRQTIEAYAAREPRIKYKIRSTNGHICAASNTALGLATGEWVALLDHDDVLWPNALFEVVREMNEHPAADMIYTDEDKLDDNGEVHSHPFFKPAWSPDYLRAINYITHFTLIKKQLVDKVGGFREGYEGAQDWDLFLRLSRVTDKIYHVPKIVYSWRMSPKSTASKASAKRYAYDNQQKVLIDDAKARGLSVKSMKWAIKNLIWKPDYAIKGNPKVSIIIPTKDQYKHISKCLKSITHKTTYKNLELIIVDTGSTEEGVLNLYKQYQKKLSNFKVLDWHNKPFNFSSVCNFGAGKASGQYLLFLNNDTEIISKDWIEGLLQFAQQAHVGAVGCKLLYPNGKLQHSGVILGVGGSGPTPGVAGHLFPAYRDHPFEDWHQLLYAGGVRDFSAVTAACLMVSKTKFNKVNGFDSRFQIAWNDVDFCLKLRQAGLYNVYTPHVKLYHYESVSVGAPGSANRDLDVFNKEIAMFGNKWGWDYINNDPYYHPEFRKDTANVRLKLPE